MRAKRTEIDFLRYFDSKHDVHEHTVDTVQILLLKKHLWFVKGPCWPTLDFILLAGVVRLTWRRNSDFLQILWFYAVTRDRIWLVHVWEASAPPTRMNDALSTDDIGNMYVNVTLVFLN